MLNWYVRIKIFHKKLTGPANASTVFFLELLKELWEIVTVVIENYKKYCVFGMKRTVTVLILYLPLICDENSNEILK